MTDCLRHRAQDAVQGLSACACEPEAIASRARWAGLLFLLVVGVMTLSGCVLFVHRGSTDNLLPTGQQPDKILYQKSIDAIAHGHYDVGRLTLQALLNTYPDSEYLAKAKLAIADSYFEQGGTAGLTEAEAEYKDFQTFFPTAPEAPMAQYRVAMSHFRLMGKPDRDLSQIRLAQAEFKEFLLKYPDSDLMPRAKARLREVQEVLAQGEFEIARFYFEKRANPAAESRLLEIVNHYPSFSDADKACWYLAQTYERLKKPNQAVPYYARILTDYPLSPMVPDAKGQLVAMHQPVPQASRATLARAHADALHDVQLSLMQKVMGTFSSAPNLNSTRHGPVVLTNPSNNPVMMAKNPQPGESSGTTIAVQPVGEEALKSGKAVDPAAATDNSAVAKASGDPKEKDKTSDKSSDEKETATVPKKKSGPLHMFKKVLKPF
ncbi:MAG TPA: outer membrane protein assembly factor BamD [Terriglobia bacterium]|nr:outer membrane protein assembly factor BamD [Terriglobia bacterium]